MGLRSVNFCFTPGENEQIETVIKMPEEKRSIIEGIVIDRKNNVVVDAIVKLYESSAPNEQKPKSIACAFTDECGQFVFGPLEASKHYIIKVWINNVKIREMVIRPESKSKPTVRYRKKPMRQFENRETYIEDVEVVEENLECEYKESEECDEYIDCTECEEYNEIDEAGEDEEYNKNCEMEKIDRRKNDLMDDDIDN